jgi:hypothetical protein
LANDARLDAHAVDDEYDDWRRPAGIFVLAPIVGPAAAVIHDLQERHDPKLAAAFPPHITLAGSSGVGPIRAGTSRQALERALGPIADNTEPLILPFGRPHRFMQTDIISLPLDPHGPLRILHDLIAQSDLVFGPVRYTFTPHVTLNLYRTLTADARRVLLAVDLAEPAQLDRLTLSVADVAGRPGTMLELRFGGR